jgi:hypothetical protein
MRTISAIQLACTLRRVLARVVVDLRPSMVKVDGLWVHQSKAAPEPNWERMLDDVCGQRIGSVLKA